MSPSAVVWESSIADEKLWADLHQHFNEPELVELGHQQVLGDTNVGLSDSNEFVESGT